MMGKLLYRIYMIFFIGITVTYYYTIYYIGITLALKQFVNISSSNIYNVTLL